MFKFLKDTASAVNTQTITVGNYRVQIVRQIAEGGFAFVYMVKDAKENVYALKRLFASDREDAAVAKFEVDLANNLPPHPNIVKFLGASISATGGKVEALILMEMCQSEGLLGVLNTLFSQRRSMQEEHLLDILIAIGNAVAHLHSQRPPIWHRDIKVENILQDSRGTWKLCDFGSATDKEIRCMNNRDVIAIEDSLNHYSTPSHRSPEMCDLHAGHLVNYMADVWALGCSIYRAAFLKNAFEDTKLSVINGRFTPPHNSPYSDEFHNLLSLMLTKDPAQRPDIFEIVTKACALRRVQCPVQRPAHFIHTAAPSSKSSSSSSSASTEPIQRSIPPSMVISSSVGDDWADFSSTGNMTPQHSSKQGRSSRRRHGNTPSRGNPQTTASTSSKGAAGGGLRAENLGLFDDSPSVPKDNSSSTQSGNAQPVARGYSQPAGPSGKNADPFASNDLFQSDFFSDPFGSNAQDANRQNTVSPSYFDTACSLAPESPHAVQLQPTPSDSPQPVQGNVHNMSKPLPSSFLQQPQPVRPLPFGNAAGISLHNTQSTPTAQLHLSSSSPSISGNPPNTPMGAQYTASPPPLSSGPQWNQTSMSNTPDAQMGHRRYASASGVSFQGGYPDQMGMQPGMFHNGMVGYPQPSPELMKLNQVRAYQAQGGSASHSGTSSPSPHSPGGSLL